MAKDRPPLLTTTALTAPRWLSTLLRGLWLVAVVGLCAMALPEVVALGHGVLAVMLVTIAAITLFCFTRPGRFWLLLYPALLVVALTVLIPIGHTAWLSLMRMDEDHQLSFQQRLKDLLSERYVTDHRYPYQLYQSDNGQLQLLLTEGENAEFATQPTYLSAPFPALPDDGKQPTETQLKLQQRSPDLLQLAPGTVANGLRPLTIRDKIPLRRQLKNLMLRLPQNPNDIELVYGGMGHFSEYAYRYHLERDASGDELLNNRQAGLKYRIDHSQGEFVLLNRTPGQTPISYSSKRTHEDLDGFVVYVGMDNYRRWLTEPGLFQPLGQITLWNISYALLTTALAALLASVNAWAIAASRSPRLWLGLLVVPAAVPAVVLILTLRGLFNQHFGEFSLLLEQALGLRFDWFTTPSITKVMLVLTALWLLVPLLTLWWLRLAEGLSAPRWWPLVKALWPRAKAPLLMILSMQLLAFTAIDLHTAGRPDIIGASVPAGTTDTLTSLGSRIAFEGGGGHNYGLAASLLLPLLVLALALGDWRWRLLQPQPDMVAAGARLPGTVNVSALLWRLLATVIALLPLVLLVLISLRSGNFAVCQVGPELVFCLMPESLSLDHWRLALDIAVTDADGSVTPPPYPLLAWLGNSLLVAVGAALAVLAIALLAARALARNSQSHWLLRLLISLQLVTPALLLVSYYSISDQIGQHWPHVGFDSQRWLVLLLLPALLLALPPLVAAFSHSPQRRLWPSLRHQSRPVAAVGLLTLLLQLGEYPVTSLMLPYGAHNTAAQLIESYTYPSNYYWGGFAAAALLFSLPVMLLFYLLIPLVNRDLINHWRPL